MRRHPASHRNSSRRPFLQANDEKNRVPEERDNARTHLVNSANEGTAGMIQSGSLDLFAGVPVTDYATALKWYKQLLGSPPAFFPHDTEAVWELAQHRYLYIVQQQENAGHARLTLFVGELDALVSQIGDRGIDPAATESYPNGVRKIIYRDADGNEIGFGGGPR